MWRQTRKRNATKQNTYLRFKNQTSSILNLSAFLALHSPRVAMREAKMWGWDLTSDAYRWQLGQKGEVGTGPSETRTKSDKRIPRTRGLVPPGKHTIAYNTATSNSWTTGVNQTSVGHHPAARSSARWIRRWKSSHVCCSRRVTKSSVVERVSFLQADVALHFEGFASVSELLPHHNGVCFHSLQFSALLWHLWY